MWKLGLIHSVPAFSHFSNTGAPASRLHLILLLRQLRQAACLLAMWRSEINKGFLHASVWVLAMAEGWADCGRRKSAALGNSGRLVIKWPLGTTMKPS